LNCYFTLRDLWILRHGNGAPIWRTIVSLETSTLLNVASVLVVAAAVGYVVRRVALYRFANREDVRCSSPWFLGVLMPALTALAFLFLPPMANQVFRLSPFPFSLVFPALSLALLVSLVAWTPGRAPNRDDERSRESRRFLSLRLMASGLLAAVGTWESTLGAAYAVLAPFLALLWPIRMENSVGRIAGVWLVGFVAGFAAEAHWLSACSWLSLSPAIPPFAWAFVFLLTGLVPMTLVIRFGADRRLFVGWGAVLVSCAVWFGYRAAVIGASGSETFVRRCLADLGERKLVIADGIFDDMFRELASPEVRVVGTHTVADREFLINFFAEDEALTNRAPVVTLCYSLPEFDAAAREAGLVRREPTKPKVARRAAAEMTEAEKEQYVAAVKAESEKLMRPAADALKAMGEDFAKIPAEKRSAEIEKARLTLRNSWGMGVAGYRISSMLLALDMMQGDKRALESDALTALMLNRNDPAANAVIGELRLAEGKTDDAERYLEKAVKGEGAMAMCDYARVLVTRERYAEAEEWARKAVAKRPQDPAMREPLIAALVESRQFEAADREIKEMLGLARGSKLSAQHWAFAAQVSKRIKELKSK